MAEELKGRFRAKAKTWDFGESEKGTEQIAVDFEIVDGDERGRRITWYGYFTEKTEERTIESLRICGWVGDDISGIVDLPNEVELVIEPETYEGKTRSRVKWVNRAGGLALKTRLDEGRKASLAERLRGRIAAVDQKLAASAPAGAGAEPKGDVPF
jgi:hypothetical protein